MICNFKHQGLKRLYEHGDRSKLNPQQINKIEMILADLDAANTLQHLRQPGYRLHSLRGHFSGQHSITVTGNWRIVFRFEAGQVSDIDLVDYH